MTTIQKSVSKWILIVSGFFAIMELMVSVALYVAPETVVDTVDLTAKGVGFLIAMWAVRQFALGCILAVATYKRSVPMLTLAYIFLLVMFAGDCLVGISQNEPPLIIAALAMCGVAGAMLVAVGRVSEKRNS